ncbi:hypothetical protein [Aeromonas veronii]|uniref:hypothetical protein n=1 Tax=Aeromonas veronii TaxID=654 RepID=UPI003A3B584D
MPQNPLRKGTLLIPSGGTDHLFFICNDPIFYPNLAKECFLAVNISTIKQGIEHDTTCQLNVGDHPFVRHPSFVFYKKAEIWGAVTVSQEIAMGNIRPHVPCEDPVFTRVLEGFGISPHVLPRIRAFYQKYC